MNHPELSRYLEALSLLTDETSTAHLRELMEVLQ